MHISSNSCRGYTRSQTSYVRLDYGLLTTVDKMIGHAKGWVQLCGKNRYKVIILIMHKGMRGKWDFIDMIKGGVACLANEVRVQGLQRRGCLPVPVPPLLDKQQSMVQNKYNAQAHD